VGKEIRPSGRGPPTASRASGPPAPGAVVSNQFVAPRSSARVGDMDVWAEPMPMILCGNLKKGYLTALITYAL
jgi:hypothetical protein